MLNKSSQNQGRFGTSEALFHVIGKSSIWRNSELKKPAKGGHKEQMGDIQSIHVNCKLLHVRVIGRNNNDICFLLIKWSS